MEKLLLIDDEVDVQYSFRRIFESPELEVHTASSGEEGLKLLAQVKPDLVISDIRMAGLTGLETLRRIRQTDARLPVILMTAYGTTQMAIEAMKLGAFDYVLKPFDVPRLKQLVESALRAAREMKQTVVLQPLLEQPDYDLGVVGRSEAMQQVFKLIGQVSGSDATVLVTGESGTGKELVARAIYQNSRRAQQPFIALNCAAIPENLLESELFGHEKGAFTGASAQRIGKFEQGNGGTVFLDEIGDMPLATQTKILRVLQDGTFERVGGNQTVKADVRIIAATNKPLEQAVEQKQFREDLFYRLNVVRIPLPPLRERREDIRLLVDYFLRKLTAPGTKTRNLAASALAALESYHWPGNVRELENIIRRATVVAKGSAILLADLPSEIAHIGPSSAVTTAPTNAPHVPMGAISTSPIGGLPPIEATPTNPAASLPNRSAQPTLAELAQTLFRYARIDPKLKVLPAVERELVIEALKETRGNQVQAAKLLGITRATLRKRVEKFGIKQELNVA